MKYKRNLISIAMATLVLVSLCAVCVSTSVSAADSGSSTNAQLPPAPAGVVGTPAAVQDANNLGSFDLFVQGSGYALMHNHYQPTSGWSGWESLGGYVTSSPAAVSTGYAIDVFARGGDGALLHDHGYNVLQPYGYSILWSGWESLGGRLAPNTGPAVSSWAAGRLDVFVVGTDNALWHTYSQGSWGGWDSLGGYLTSSPAASSWSNGRIDVDVRGGDGALWHKYFQGSWGSWASLGGRLASGTGPAKSSLGNGRLDIFVVGTDNALWHKYWHTYQQGKGYNSAWSGWESLGGVLTSSPGVTSQSSSTSGIIDVYAGFPDGALWHTSGNAIFNQPFAWFDWFISWSAWKPLGVPRPP